MKPKPIANPRYDSELQAFLDANPAVSRVSLRPEGIPQLRKDFVSPSIEQIVGERDIEVSELSIPGYEGATIALTVLRSRRATHNAPGIYHTHSGGMIAGDRYIGLALMAQFVDEFAAVCTSVEYRLAPEFPDPYPIEDCWSGLKYVAEHLDDLGIDPGRLIVAGMSAGGGLAAGLALMARDRGGVKLAGQLLMCPMLDESNDSDSSHQFVNLGLWDRGSNDTGWNALLGDRRHSDQVTAYASPSRAESLHNLPPAFIDVGSLEVFRSEDVDYARRIWAEGGDAELHVWANAFHGFDLAHPNATVSKLAIAARRDWLARLFSGWK